MSMRKIHKQKWTAKDFFRLWGLFAAIALVLCLVNVLFYIGGRGEGFSHTRTGTTPVQETPPGLTTYLYAAGAFGGMAVICILLMTATILYSRFLKDKRPTTVLKRRRR